MYLCTNQKDLRAIFWGEHPQFKRKGNHSQNSYPADVRMAWVDWLDHLCRNGDISEQLAQKATL